MSATQLQAELYHAQHAAYQEDLLYWQALVERCPAPALELGCGTGRILLPLVKRGFSVWGVDRDPEMLHYLRQQIDEWPAEDIQLIEADMADFAIPQSFGLIFSPCNTISTLADTDRKATFTNLRSHLLPEGIFAASLPNPLLLEDLLPQPEPELETEILHPRSGNPVQISASYWRAGSVFILNWHYDQLFPDGRVERISVTQHQHLLSPEAWRIALHQGGFDVLEMWGDFDRRPFTAESPHLIWEARPSRG
jgi:SAM-dependent methyltransferase